MFELECSSMFTCVVGQNGMGKTNLLDAVYYTGLTKSYFHSNDRQAIRKGEQFFTIITECNQDGEDFKVFCNYVSGQKKVVKLNDKPYQKMADHIGKIPTVMITPGDLYLISEYSEERRKFIDSILCQFDVQYLEKLMSYQKVLHQRNALLKNQFGFDINLLQVYDSQLVRLGEVIYEKRMHFISDFAPRVKRFYKAISKGKEEVKIEYHSQLKEEKLTDLLAQFLEKDRITQRSNYGIHKDDYLFTMNRNSFKKYGSQGQQKSFVFALKLAQAEIMQERSGKLPILLLDDIFDRLDNSRIESLLNLLKTMSIGHVFLSDTDPQRVRKVISENKVNAQIIEIESGKLAHNEKG